MHKSIDIRLQNYIENKILPRYDNNIGGHGIEHIRQVIERSFEIVREFDISIDDKIVYIVAVYHDLGYKDNPDNHEQLSADLFMSDEFIKSFLTDEEIEIVYEAIIDHRASLEYDPRNIYGKIVSSADREISVENMLRRSYLYQSDKHKSENPTRDEIIEYSYKKLSSKYGKGGYAKMYFPDKKYLDFLREMQSLIEDKAKFVARERNLKF